VADSKGRWLRRLRKQRRDGSLVKTRRRILKGDRVLFSRGEQGKLFPWGVSEDTPLCIANHALTGNEENQERTQNEVRSISSLCQAKRLSPFGSALRRFDQAREDARHESGGKEKKRDRVQVFLEVKAKHIKRMRSVEKSERVLHREGDWMEVSILLPSGS